MMDRSVLGLKDSVWCSTGLKGIQCHWVFLSHFSKEKAIIIKNTVQGYSSYSQKWATALTPWCPFLYADTNTYTLQHWVYHNPDIMVLSSDSFENLKRDDRMWIFSANLPQNYPCNREILSHLSIKSNKYLLPFASASTLLFHLLCNGW